MKTSLHPSTWGRCSTQYGNPSSRTFHQVGGRGVDRHTRVWKNYYHIKCYVFVEKICLNWVFTLTKYLFTLFHLFRIRLLTTNGVYGYIVVKDNKPLIIEEFIFSQFWIVFDFSICICYHSVYLTCRFKRSGSVCGFLPPLSLWWTGLFTSSPAYLCVFRQTVCVLTFRRSGGSYVFSNMNSSLNRKWISLLGNSWKTPAWMRLRRLEKLQKDTEEQLFDLDGPMWMFQA